MLKPAKKGEIRNPKGKPVGTLNRSTILRKWLEAAGKMSGGTVADDMALALIAKALKGDVAAFKELYDGAFGKVVDKQESKVEVDASIRGLSETADFLSGVAAKRSKGTL